MGLDMYLEARKYVSRADYNAGETTANPAYTAIMESNFPEGADKYGEFAGATVEMTVAYWRKSNSIHEWFVNECGGGVDECQPIRVPIAKLRELRATVEHVLEHRNDASKVLPTAAGFFFGSTEYDEWYWSDLERTKEILDFIIPMAEDEEWEMVYQASW